jgi:hypothetical protein
MGSNVIMGCILLVIAFCMILGAIIMSPKLGRMRIKHSARYSFAAVCILTGTYLGWISTFFFRDVLGPENYTPELWALRVSLMLACIHFLWNVWRC